MVAAPRVVDVYWRRSPPVVSGRSLPRRGLAVRPIRGGVARALRFYCHPGLGNFFGPVALQTCGVVTLSSDLFFMSKNVVSGPPIVFCVRIAELVGRLSVFAGRKSLAYVRPPGTQASSKPFLRGRPELSEHGTLPCRIFFAAPEPRDGACLKGQRSSGGVRAGRVPRDARRRRLVPHFPQDSSIFTAASRLFCSAGEGR